MHRRRAGLIAAGCALFGGTVLLIRRALNTSASVAPEYVPQLRTDPPSDSPLRPEARAGFPAFTQRFEGRVPTMYRDVKGYVTTGVGNLIDPVTLALSLPWLHADGSAATPDEVRAEWQRVKSMPAGMVASHYASSDGLHLSDDAIDALVLRHIDADAKYLQSHYFPDLVLYPASVETAIMSNAWAMGAGWPGFSRYADCVAAIKSGDWNRVADTCAIPSAGNKGVEPRNAANAALFREAASVA